MQQTIDRAGPDSAVVRPAVTGAVAVGPVRPAVAQQLVTALIVGLPSLALAWGAVRLVRHGIGARDLVIATALYAITGHGIAVGFHRLFTHRSFIAARPLKIAIAVAGSMAFEGGPVGWVADHRRHHAHTDRDGDPHSPYTAGPGPTGRAAGLRHAHTGWLFSHSPTDTARFAGDIRRDRDLAAIDRLFPLWCTLSLAVPFGLGWVLGGTISAGFVTLMWAGLVRVAVLHHVTWSVNSVCHMFGRRPFDTPDRSTNVAALAVVSFGESWHNAHHAYPAAARLGVGRHQIDSSATLIRAFERLGWARDVRRASGSVRATRTADARQRSAVAGRALAPVEQGARAVDRDDRWRG
jgi:stearoyl-CoA desaturase (delta-9 desaturase)